MHRAAKWGLVLVLVLVLGCSRYMPASHESPSPSAGTPGGGATRQTPSGSPDQLTEATLQRWGRVLTDGEEVERISLAKQLASRGDDVIPLLNDVLDHPERYGKGQLPGAVGVESSALVCWILAQIDTAAAADSLHTRSRFPGCRAGATALAERKNSTGTKVLAFTVVYREPSTSSPRLDADMGARVRVEGRTIIDKDQFGRQIQFIPVKVLDAPGQTGYVFDGPDSIAFF